MSYLRKLENMTAKCLELSYSSPNPDVYDDPVPSTSGINTTVTSNKVNDSMLNSSTSFDEQYFGTQNKDHLETQLQVEIIDSSMSYEFLPELQLTIKDDLTPNEEKQEDLEVTTFRAVNEDDKAKRRSRRDKFIKFDVRSSCSDSE